MKHSIHRFGLATGALAFSALLMSCMSSNQSTEGEGLRLSGRVVATNSAPVAGVIVALAHNGAKDTTDAQGHYELFPASARQGGAAQDTIVYIKNGQALARVSVATWVDTLPDVQVVQRDVSGLLIGSGTTISRIEGVVTGDGIDSAAPVSADFYYNPLTGNYSGFLYFPAPSSVQNYAVRVKVYGPGDVLVGTSQLVPFNSNAGNVTVPSFGPGNAIPGAKAGLDTAVVPGATVRLHAAAVDSNGTIVKWEWSIGGSSFVVSSGDTTFSRTTEGAYPCILRVTDNDGNQALDTMTVAVLSAGVTWTTRTSGTTASLTSVTWTGSQFVAVGSGGTVLTSSDGITWASHTVLGYPSFAFVAWNGHKLAAVTTSGGPSSALYTAISGDSNWISVKLPGALSTIGTPTLSAADTTFFIGDLSSTSRTIGRSLDDGTTWMTDTIPRSSGVASLSARAFTRHNGRFVGVGSNGVTVSSVNGGTWTKNSDETTWPRPAGGVVDYTMTSVVSTGSFAVAVGYAGHVTRSADGMAWQQPKVAGNIPDQVGGSSLGDLQSVVWTGKALVAVGNSYHMVSADTGLNWARVPTVTTTLRSVAWNGTRLVAVGGTGIIVTSP